MTKKLAIICCLLAVSFIWFAALLTEGAYQYLPPMVMILVALAITANELLSR